MLMMILKLLELNTGYADTDADTVADTEATCT